MKDVIEFFVRQKNKIGNIVLDEMKILVAGEMPDVGRIARDQIVDRDHTVTFGEKSIDQMRSQKTRATGNNRNGFGFLLGHSRIYLSPDEPIASTKQSFIIPHRYIPKR